MEKAERQSLLMVDGVKVVVVVVKTVVEVVVVMKKSWAAVDLPVRPEKIVPVK